MALKFSPMPKAVKLPNIKVPKSKIAKSINLSKYSPKASSLPKVKKSTILKSVLSKVKTKTKTAVAKKNKGFK